ncbi:uncharacterized protein N0V89_003230 [Didymosphaeria variabile]|uniref:F-box domain-containing protein n=1 Tax=Didymosphaeria variabile TaxID=1932322 RepID=A0A9W8XU09_9PLEO|nr:uncharacterized protein N0V89_003230 [Didymosphaeria variabile]KAJ4358646.1 hypothetical protein N0V89_003230 [Didymosphaeria variabile]
MPIGFPVTESQGTNGLSGHRRCPTAARLDDEFTYAKKLKKTTAEASQQLTVVKKRPIGFLDLPAELRNRVYDYAVESEPFNTDLVPLLTYRPMTQNTWSTKHLARSTRKHFGLTQVCKRVRIEYLPLWKCNVWLKISYHDFYSFVDTFYAQHEEDTPAPKWLQIVSDHGGGLDDLPKPRVDLLRFLRFGIRFSATEIEFIPRGHAELYKPERGPDYRLGECPNCWEEGDGITRHSGNAWAEHRHLHTAWEFLRHNNADWLADIKSGFIAEARIREWDGKYILGLGLSIDGLSCYMSSQRLTLYEKNEENEEGYREYGDWLDYCYDLGLDAEKFTDLEVLPYYV